MIAGVSWNEHNGSFTEEEVYIERDGGGKVLKLGFPPVRRHDEPPEGKVEEGGTEGEVHGRHGV